MKLNSTVLRDYLPTDSELAAVRAGSRQIYLLLDNVQDTYNIGSFFRLADAFGVSKIYMTGASECPPNIRIDKAAVGTQRWVAWEYGHNAASTIKSVRQQIAEIQVVAIEQDERSVNFDTLSYQMPLLLVLGHETYGVSGEVLDLCDAIVSIPMYGINVSMNVVMSAAVVLGRL